MELIINDSTREKYTGPTICLNMIVKNESKVITRMFDAIVDIIDCYCICDTGSNDNTVEIITDYFIEKGITGKIIYYPFKNFAHNRNIALQSCKGMSDYVLLLDADMILKVNEKFVKTALKEDFYYLFQGNESFYYQNVRIVKNNGLFSYSGVTHEHINIPSGSIGGQVFDKKIIFIDDIGDGGSKSDKFKRDIILLEQGLIDEPNSTRYVFYLGNSYRDNGDDDKAIDTYKKQLNMNAWAQEKYCSCISIGNIYYKKNDKVNAAKFWLKSSEYDNERIEGIVKAMDYYRHEGDNLLVNVLYHKYKGYKRNLAEGKLFVEQDKYKDVLEFNNSISAYYANDKESGYECCKQILCHGIMDVGNMKKTLENMQFYKEFLLKDTKEDREKLFNCVDKLLDLLNEKKNENEIWRILNVKNDRIVIEEVVIDTRLEINLEEVYQKIKQFRIEGKSQEAMDLYNSISKDHPKYSQYLWKLAYEYSVFAYYTGVRNINNQVVSILNNCDSSSLINSVLSNMKFYPDILNSDKTYDYTFSLTHKINDIEYKFNSSSSCIIPYKDVYLFNVRLVNYEIDAEGSYINCDKHVISLYKSITLSKDFVKLDETLIDIDYVDRRYIGIEDVRIFKDDDNNKILFTGTGYHNNNTVGVVCGEYSEVNYIWGKPLNSIEFKPAFNLDSACEKNWTYVKYKGDPHMIYSWFPLKICKVNKNTYKLDLVEERVMPDIFKHARGSSCGSNYIENDEIWFVVHIVSYEKPRHYYHMLAVFDLDMNLLRYSAPFKLQGECIEYCIGLVVEEERVLIPYSTMDRTTKLAVYSKKYIDSKMINANNITNAVSIINESVSNSVLFVTAFKNLDRHNWKGFERSIDNYIEWFKNLSMAPIRLICYCDNDIADILKHKLQFLNTYPYEEKDTFLRFIDKEQEIMESAYFKDLVSPRNDPEINKPGYNSVNHNKVWFIKRAKSMFPSYTHYAWIDFGFIRETENIPIQLDFHCLSKDKITYACKKPIHIDKLLTPIEACKNINSQCLLGGVFFCPKDMVDWYYEEYYNMVMWYYKNNLVDDDQEIVKQILKSKSNKFDFIITGGWFKLLKHFQVPLAIDVVIPTCLKDIDTLDFVITGVKKNIANLRNIYIVCNLKYKDKITQGIFIDEETYPFSIEDISEILFGDRYYKTNNSRSTGWWFQQLLKLYSFKVIKGISSNILIVDSETIFYNKYTPIRDNIAYYAVSNEVSNEYRSHMKYLLEDINIYSNNISGICHQMLFQTHVLQNLFDRTELYYNDRYKTREHFWKIMATISNTYKSLQYSEYDLYFNFALTFHRNTVKIANDIRWDISGMIPYSSDYIYLTVHSHIRGIIIKPNQYVVEDKLLIENVKSIENVSVLFFTAFKDIGRSSWSTYKRTTEHYLSWFSNLIQLPINIICYCEKDMSDKISEQIGFTNMYPYDEESTFFKKYNDREREVFDSESFKNLTGHRESPECKNFGYNLVNHNKYSFLKRTKNNFPNYTHYAWIDFGYVRNKQTNIDYSYNFNSLGNKVLYSAFYTPHDREDTDPKTLCINPKNINPYNIIQGSSFIVCKDEVDWLYTEYEKIMVEYYDLNLIDQDQAHILQLYKKFPEKFDLNITPNWFTLLDDRFKFKVDINKKNININLNKTIYMTYKKQVPDIVIDRWKTLNPEYNIELSLDSDCLDFIKSNFNEHVVEFYKQIPFGAYKADLWRLCKLYINGGVYADVDLVPYINIDALDKDITFYSCLSIGLEYIFQAFIVNFSKPKNPLILAFLMSFLLNSPHRHNKGPTHDMYKCIKYNFDGKDIVPDTKYNLTSIKIPVYIGLSDTNTKYINLGYFPNDITYSLNIKSHQFKDRFNFSIVDNTLVVTRLDENYGWGYEHSCDIIINSMEKIYIFKENSGENNDWVTSFVTHNGKKILDSRDLNYHNNNGW
jgi:hypothetical protein